MPYDDVIDFGTSIDFSLSKLSSYEGMSMAEASFDDAIGRGFGALSITAERIARDETLLGTYEVRSDAIPGGMGSVWRVRHMSWDAELAMKRPHPQLFSEASPEIKRGFVRECEHWINLGLHPHIVSCYYVREVGGVPTVFAEWMDGGSLADAIASGRLYEGTPQEQAERLLDVAIQVARGLAYAHEQGLLHQDVKPGNILLTQGFEAKVADFGLAKAADVVAGDQAERSSGRTPAYAPAKQTAGAVAERWMDVFSWALTVLEACLGARPWDTGAEAAEKLTSYFPDCRVPLPLELQALLVRCVTEQIDGFAGVLGELERIYRQEVGVPYPRPLADAAADTVDALNNRALSFLDLGKADEARALWQLALRRNPDDVRSVYNSGLAELRAKGEEAGDAYAVAAEHNDLANRVGALGGMKATYEKNLLMSRLFCSSYGVLAAEDFARRALDLCPETAADRTTCKEQLERTRHAWSIVPADPSRTGTIAFDRQGSRIALAWVEHPGDGGDSSWTQLAVIDLEDREHPRQRRLTELDEGADARLADTPTFHRLRRVLCLNDAIYLIDHNGGYLRYDFDSLELVGSGDDVDELTFELPARDDWPYVTLSDGLRSVCPTVEHVRERSSMRGTSRPRLDIESLWANGNSKGSPGFFVGTPRGSAEDNGLAATYPAQGLRHDEYAVCADHEGKFLLVYDAQVFSPAPPSFCLLDTEVFGRLPDYALARVVSYKQTIDAEEARRRALEAAKQALNAADHAALLAALDEAYRLFPDEPGDEWTELNERAGAVAVRERLRGVRSGRQLEWPHHKIVNYRSLNKPIVELQAAGTGRGGSFRILGAREPGDTRWGEWKLRYASELAGTGSTDLRKVISRYTKEPLTLPDIPQRERQVCAYDSGKKLLYTCGNGEMVAWDAREMGEGKRGLLWSLRFGQELPEFPPFTRSAIDDFAREQAPFDPDEHGKLWALKPEAIFLNRACDADIAFVRSKLLHPYGPDGQIDLRLLSVIDLRSRCVVHAEPCHDEHWVSFESSRVVARVLTLVGLSDDGYLAAFSHDEAFAGDGQVELWDMEQPGTFAKHLASPQHVSVAGLRGDGGALLFWGGFRKQGGASVDTFEEELLDWRYRLPEDASWKEQQERERVARGGGAPDENARSGDRGQETSGAAGPKLSPAVVELKRKAREAREQAERRRAEQEAREQAERERAERAMREQVERERAERREREEREREREAQRAETKAELEAARAELGSLSFFQGRRKRELRARIAELEARLAQ